MLGRGGPPKHSQKKSLSEEEHLSWDLNDKKEQPQELQGKKFPDRDGCTCRGVECSLMGFPQSLELSE